MDTKNTDDLLQQLHDEINSIDNIDKKGVELLADLDKDIRHLLERSGEHPMQVHPSIFNRFDLAIHHFEITHPDLTDLLAKVVSSLSNAGV